MSSAPPAIEFHHSGAAPLDAPPPLALSGVQPAWFKAMPAAVPEALRRPEDVTHLTVRACAPFAEAMALGYTVPWPATTDIFIAGRHADGAWDVRFQPALPAILNAHPPKQAPGMPASAYPILKLLNPWIVRTPPGASCLFTPLLNQFEAQLIPFAAVVDTDRFFAPIHFPFVLVPPREGRVRIERGAPFVQVIPFRREEWTSALGDGDPAARAATEAAMAAEPDGVYARRFRARKRFG